ncbi:MAG: GNAT family N-acetyltransferase [Bifidobacteriaceae bacterium]|jgi:GNAT superfamily N-acetyltransferase|nr:GNAT family N-acetyltransferase [Bifidobacteriaceae bacterium]
MTGFGAPSGGMAQPRKLARGDVRDGFRSGADELDRWLTEFAWQNQVAGNAVTYVTLDGQRVVGYYAIAMAAVTRAGLPAGLHPGRRPTQVPCLLLARLAVDRRYQGQGLGLDLLRDALVRAVHFSTEIGTVAVLVHCRDQAAKDFYLRGGDFLVSPIDRLQLLAPIAALAQLIQGRA